MLSKQDKGTIHQARHIFFEMKRHYSQMRLFKYENFHYEPEDFVMFSIHPSVIYSELIAQTHQKVEVSSYTKELSTFLYVNGDDYRIEIEFFN